MDPSGPVVDWLLDGDVSVQYQTRRDLLGDDDPTLQARMATEGYAAALLAARTAGGGWGRAYYQPKWTSSHYTLLELRNLGLAPDQPVAREAVAGVLRDHLDPDGGIDPGGWTDTCVNGMALSFCAWFGGDAAALDRMVDWLLVRRLADGGFNCRADRSGATHSSHHTTVSVLEGLATYLAGGHDHRRTEVEAAVRGCADYLLAHRLFRSHGTGEVIHPEFVRPHHPPRWHFDVLRGLDALAAAGVPYDSRMDDALGVLVSLRRRDGTWPAGRTWPGEIHVPMDRDHRSRWVTLQALRVLRRYG